MMSFLIKDVPTGKLNALVKNIGGLDIMDGILDGTVKFTVIEGQCLSSTSTITLPASKKRFNPDEYYQTREGLYVWEGFRNRIVPATSPIEQVPGMEIFSFDLDKSMNDAEIRAKLPKNHVFENASIFCAYLGGMIDRQPKGKEGDLLSNGYANIFYVRGLNSELFAVNVLWDAVNREWDVNADSLDDDRWSAGIRAFSATADA